MDSSFGPDPAEYWIKLTYDDGSEEITENLTLNQAYHLENEKRNEQSRQYRDWVYPKLKRHIKHIKTGRTR